MAISPPVNNSNLILRPFDTELIKPRYIGWLNDAELMQFSRQRFYTHTSETCKKFADGFLDSPSYFWAVIAKDPTLGHIGNLTANVDPHNRIAELTILIGERKAQGKGLGLQAWELAMDCLFNLGFRKLTAGTMAVNLRMLNIIRRSGMIEDGVRAKHFLYQDKEVDCVLFAKFLNAGT